MNIYLYQLWRLADLLFLIGLAIALFLGSKVTPLLLVAGLLPIPFLLNALKNRHYHVSIWRLLVPFSLYFGYCLLTLFFFTGLEASDPRPVNPSLESYAIAIAMLAVGLIRGLQIRNLALLFRRVMPWLLVACFIVLSYMMFAGIRDACRVRGLAPWPFIPALLFSTLTFICLVSWEKLTGAERWLRVALMAFSIVISTTYTGSRGVALAQVGVFGVFLILGFLPSLKGKIPSWYHLGLAASAGLMVSFFIGVVTDCGPASRFSSTFETLQSMATQLTETEDQTAVNVDPAPETGEPFAATSPAPETLAESNPSVAVTKDEAISHRLAMWETSITAIKDSPIFGHGSLYLQKLIHATYGYEHNHNQYLTWLVTGGVIQLTLGLIFLAIPWFVSKGLTAADRIMLTVGVSLFWGGAMMFDAFLNLKFYTHYLCLLSGLLYALSNSMQDEGTR
ncbi:O-Antigen ligase [Rhizobium sp. RU33A]|uniref:O-antigen ligase family protein n=1 Tax=Rhizobium sp. RU33A TaxID=1907413 RepID=UPI0009557388|nr:O-antigen ligase family protein [Rhizobium sp. RU33A]SIQ89779.1 O-Antigen ligase [Rhizobium sp. RU33A]